MIASLPMYDFGAIAGANDRWWAATAEALRARDVVSPARLTRGFADYLGHWRDPGLLLSQTCGFPYRTVLHPHVTLVCTPDYGLPNCPAGHFNSVFVARDNDRRGTLADFDGAALAYNSADSQSGWAAPQTHAAAMGLTLRAGPATGAHALSALAVLEARADLAAIDAVTWRLLAPHDPRMSGLRELARTRPTPGLPLITAQAPLAPLLRAALTDALDRLDGADRALLGIRSLPVLQAAAYHAVPNPPAPGAMQAAAPL